MAGPDLKPDNRDYKRWPHKPVWMCKCCSKIDPPQIYPTLAPWLPAQGNVLQNSTSCRAVSYLYALFCVVSGWETNHGILALTLTLTLTGVSSIFFGLQWLYSNLFASLHFVTDENPKVFYEMEYFLSPTEFRLGIRQRHFTMQSMLVDGGYVTGEG